MTAFDHVIALQQMGCSFRTRSRFFENGEWSDWNFRPAPETFDLGTIDRVIGHTIEQKMYLVSIPTYISESLVQEAFLSPFFLHAVEAVLTYPAFYLRRTSVD